MLRYAALRLLLAVPTLLGVLVLVSALLHFVPGDPVDVMLGDGGFTADVRPLEWASLYGDVRRGSFDLVALAWFGSEGRDQ